MSKVGWAGGAERRADELFKVNFRILLTDADSPEVEGTVSNLSPGGRFIESDVRVQEDDLVKLRFDIPGRGDLTVWGNVVFWVEDTGFGVRFSAFLQGGARDKLMELLSGTP